MTAISVTAADIARGVAGDCHRCAVSLALGRATGDDGANVHEQNWTIYVEVWGRVVQAPRKVVEFVWEFDCLPRDEHGRPDKADPDYEPPAPFEFALPDPDSPAWKAKCGRCGEVVDPSDLDDAGRCPDCRRPEEGGVA